MIQCYNLSQGIAINGVTGTGSYVTFFDSESGHIRYVTQVSNMIHPAIYEIVFEVTINFALSSPFIRLIVDYFNNHLQALSETLTLVRILLK
jgi:hypothetical protein